MTPLTSETRYLLYDEPNSLSCNGQPFATAEFTHKFEGKYLFRRLSLHAYNRDVPSDGFREQINEEDWPRVFVTPDARTLRGLMGLKPDVALGIGPGLSFAWPRDRAKPLPRGSGLSESVVVSVPFIQLRCPCLLPNPLPVRPFIRPSMHRLHRERRVCRLPLAAEGW